VSLDCHWRTPETVTGHLRKGGLDVTARMLRAPGPGEPRPRALLLARRPPAGPDDGDGTPTHSGWRPGYPPPPTARGPTATDGAGTHGDRRRGDPRRPTARGPTAADGCGRLRAAAGG